MTEKPMKTERGVRRLAVFAFAFSIAAALAVYLLTGLVSLLIACGLAVAGVACLVVHGRVGLRLRLIAFGAALGMLAFFGAEALFLAPARAMSGAEGVFTCAARGFPQETERGYRVDARILTGKLPVGGRVYFDNEPEIRPGDTFTVQGRGRASDTLYGDENDALLSSGCFLFLYADGYEVTGSGSRLLYAPQYAARALHDKLCELFSGRTRAFLSALLLGDHTELYRDAGLLDALNVTGMRHIVVVSGMHLAYIVSVVQMLFGRRKRVALITAPLLFLFAAMTGFSASVVRACVMQAFLMAAPFFGREGDSITSLSAAMLLLLLLNPYAAANLGFQLTFAATGGIVLFAEPLFSFGRSLLEGREKRMRALPKRLLYFVIANLSTTLGASAFTVPIVAVRLGYTSLVSPIAGLLVTFPVSLAFLLGFAAVLLGLVWTPGGAALAFIAALPARYTTAVLRSLSSLRFAALYTVNDLAVFWLVYAFFVLLLLFLFRRRGIRLLPAVCCCVLTLSLVALVTFGTSVASDLTVTVLDVGQGQCIAVTSGDAAAVIDCGSASGYDAGKVAVSYLRSLGRREIDAVVLTHYHADHTNGADDLLAAMETGVLLAPDAALSDLECAGELAALAKSRGTDIIYVEDRMTVRLGRAVLELYPPVGDESENERGLTIVCTSGDYDVLVTGDMPSTLERRLVNRYDLPDIETLVVGHHGSKYSTSEELLAKVKPETAIISVGWNTYGHPAEETLIRLENAGATVYRTDLSGNVTVRAGGNHG